MTPGTPRPEHSGTGLPQAPRAPHKPFAGSPQPLTFRAADLPPHPPAPPPPPVHQRRRGTLLATAFGTVAASLARLTAVALFVITFLVQPTQIPSSSMEQTLLVGDLVLVNKQVFAPAGHWRWLLPYRQPRVGSLVVFHYPVDPDQLVVKRVVAVAGDRIHLRDNTLYRNGEPQAEPYAQYTPAGRSPFRDRFPNLQEADPSAEAPWWIELRSRIRDGELPVPDRSYFVMGDNRNDSLDSRYWGFVHPAAIVGEPLLTYLSIDHQPGQAPHLRRARLGHIVR
ncbi:signal peptidase I [Terriglobus aquaticus]|uniref:Signal peptidase I n=1 Tax=Terriglobus aquaticus TaxID=940139 RepID=A0ABW9KNS8_9BACT|nr:signal peptidase I [Terriglobus aquaticus]